jgi:hypothetical protein
LAVVRAAVRAAVDGRGLSETCDRVVAHALDLRRFPAKTEENAVV